MDVLGWALHNQRLRWQHLHPAVHAGIPRSFDGNLYVPAGVAMILGALATLLPICPSGLDEMPHPFLRLHDLDALCTGLSVGDEMEVAAGASPKVAKCLVA